MKISVGDRLEVLHVVKPRRPPRIVLVAEGGHVLFNIRVAAVHAIIPVRRLHGVGFELPVAVAVCCVGRRRIDRHVRKEGRCEFSVAVCKEEGAILLVC